MWVGAFAQLDSPNQASTVVASPTPLTAFTIQELMDARIDPPADALWDSVAFIASARGEEDRRPLLPIAVPESR
jgi:hypothetical protein